MAEYNAAAFIPTDRHDTYPAIDPAKADLSGKIVVLAGASKGIGRATALAIAQSGVKGLVLLARSSLDAVKKQCLAAQRPGHPLEVLTVRTDVTDNDQVVAAAKQVEKTFGHVDIVINIAGYLEHYNYIADSDPDEWWKPWNVNIRGAYHVTRAFVPLLIKSGGDNTFVNVASSAGFVMTPRISSYSTSKFASLRFTEFINAEYGDKGVLAYMVHPGAVESEMSLSLPADILAMGVIVDTLELSAHTLLWLIKERRDWLAGRYVDSQWDVEKLLARKQEIVDGDKLKLKVGLVV